MGQPPLTEHAAWDVQEQAAGGAETTALPATQNPPGKAFADEQAGDGSAGPSLRASGWAVSSCDWEEQAAPAREAQPAHEARLPTIQHLAVPGNAADSSAHAALAELAGMPAMPWEDTDTSGSRTPANEVAASRQQRALEASGSTARAERIED